MIIYALSLDGINFRYIGMTTREKIRLKEHFRNARDGSDLPVYRWIRKHGAEAIMFTVLERVDSYEKMCEREIHWIAHSRMIGHRLLNVHPGGKGGGFGKKPGYSPSEETRRKISLSQKGRTSSFKGQRHSEATKEKISNSRKGQPSNFKGKKWSEETRAKRAALGLGSGAKKEHVHSKTYAMHVRWHVNRAMTKDTCEHCFPNTAV